MIGIAIVLAIAVAAFYIALALVKGLIQLAVFIWVYRHDLAPKSPQDLRRRFFNSRLLLTYSIVVVFVGLVFRPQPPETAAQAEARAQQAEQDKQLSAHKNDLCYKKMVCDSYRDVLIIVLLRDNLRIAYE